MVRELVLKDKLEKAGVEYTEDDIVLMMALHDKLLPRLWTIEMIGDLFTNEKSLQMVAEKGLTECVKVAFTSNFPAITAKRDKMNRNAVCPLSGKKYKKCCFPNPCKKKHQLTK